jgi:hypothetical protein
MLDIIGVSLVIRDYMLCKELRLYDFLRNRDLGRMEYLPHAILDSSGEHNGLIAQPRADRHELGQNANGPLGRKLEIGAYTDGSRTPVPIEAKR